GAARLFGFDAHEIAGAPFATLFEHNEAEAGLPQHIIESCRRAPGNYHQELWLARKDGSRFRSACELVRLPAPPAGSGSPSGSCGWGVIVTDCSAQNREHQALEKLAHSFRRL